MYLLALPDDVLEKVLSYVSFDEVCRCRMVCQRFNEISKRVLNHGFHKVEKYHTKCLKQVKSQLPRRESERRNHPLARHCDILTAVETRLSLLGMTFRKFIDMNICCFIPGKVLDEIYKVLRYVTTEQSPIRAHEVMQELRDLSSMAMEYFDEKIAPALKKHKDTGPKIIMCNSIKYLRPSTSRPHPPKDSRILIMARFINSLNRRQNKLETEFIAIRMKKKEHDSFSKRLADLEQFAMDTKKKLTDTEKTVSEQQNTIANQAVQITEQELKIEKLNKLIEGKAALSCYESNHTKCRANITKKRYSAVSRIKNTPNSSRSSKRKFMHNHDKKEENVKKKLKK